MNIKHIIMVSLSVVSVAHGMEVTPLPEKMPFMKSLTMTSILLHTGTHEDTDLVEKLSQKLGHHSIVQSKVSALLKPVRKCRGELKRVVKGITFKGEQDLDNVIALITQEVGKKAASSIEELKRDKLITFDASGDAISESNYTAIKKAALKLVEADQQLKTYPLWKELKQARKELLPLMDAFLRSKCNNLEELHAAVNNPIARVNDYLNGQKQ